MPTQAFATVEEGMEFTVNNSSSAAAEIVKVIAPPQPDARALNGFSDGLSVIERGNAPMRVIPKDHKTRIFFVDDEAAKSQRAHANFASARDARDILRLERPTRLCPLGMRERL